MSLHDENGIAPDAGTRGPLEREENPHDLEADTDEPLTDEADDTIDAPEELTASERTTPPESSN